MMIELEMMTELEITAQGRRATLPVVCRPLSRRWASDWRNHGLELPGFETQQLRVKQKSPDGASYA